MKGIFNQRKNGGKYLLSINTYGLKYLTVYKKQLKHTNTAETAKHKMF